MRFIVPNPASRGDKIEWAPGEIRGVIHGGLPNKSNSRRLVPIRGRMRSIKAEDALSFLIRFAWAAKAGYQCALKGEQLLHMLRPAMETRWSLTATVFQANVRRDLDIELLCDALQKSGVIPNDRAIWEKHAWRKIDKENPRVEFVLRPILLEKVK